MSVPALLLLVPTLLSPLPDPPSCELTATALRESARMTARAILWRDVARAFQEPWNARGRLLAAAMRSHRARLAEVERIHRARVLACLELGSGPYAPQLHPAEFTATVDALYFPLVPGRTLLYEGTVHGGTYQVQLEALAEVRVIDGVTCRSVRSRETWNGVLVEETLEWFAQHRGTGDVWYLGELSMHYDEHGLLDDLDGSWTSGRDGARPGIKMSGSFVLGNSHRMEYLEDEAEDIVKIIATGVTVTTAHGTYTNCVQVEEWSPLENERETKYFAPGIGLVLEVDASGERLELVGMR